MIIVSAIPLQAEKGVFKRCRWCEGTLGNAEDREPLGPPNAAARMICTGCGRQTGWLTPKTLRKAERLARAV